MKKNITMRDIANKMNISTVTVSKALADKDGVGERLREQIKTVAEQMGYRKNVLAKDMKEGITHNIGILISERYTMNDSVYMPLQQSLSRYLMNENYYGIVEVITRDMEALLAMPKVITDCKVDGVIILGQMKLDYVNQISNTIGIPYIFFDFYYEHVNADAVISDNVYGGSAITAQLISLGHRRIGFIGNILAEGSTMDRFLGYYKALLENGIEFRRDWILDERNDFGESIDIALPEDMPTAFVCSSDETAYRFIMKLKKSGFRIPDDISVAGFGNSLYAMLSQPQLTTFTIDMEQMAQAAVQGIINKLKDENYRFGRKIISGELVMRQSTSRRSQSTWKDLKRYG